MKKTICHLSALVLIVSGLAGQTANEEKDVFNEARRMEKHVLLIFSGSDWCLPCIRIKKTILSDPGFQQFATDNLVLLIADFPQKKKLDAGKIAANEKLAEEFNPNGIFPLLLLVNTGKGAVSSLLWENYSASDFIEQIKKIIENSNMLNEYAANARLMGSAFSFIVTAENNNDGERLLKDCIGEVKRIESLLTEFSDESETVRINRNAGKTAVQVSNETYNLIQRCKHISELTGGAFDISSGALRKLYNFHKRSAQLPDKETVQSALRISGYKKIQLLPGNEVLLEKPGMHIGFGAIGKGYAADKVKKLMLNNDVKSGVINASGDLTAWGARPDGTAWRTGLAHPDDPSRIILWLSAGDLCIATSGNYEQYFEVDGIRYSHNIDPKTGYPASGIKSASVISPGAELSDALATAVAVMGVEAGLHLVNHLPETHCIIIDEHNHIYSSEKININLPA